MPRASHVVDTLPLLTAFFIVVTAPSTFCPVTSPTDELVYVTDTPSTFVVGATPTQCAFECQLSDAFSERRASQTTGCRCFNYNSTSANCSLFMFEPRYYEIDQQGNTIAYQFDNRPLQGLWRNVSLYDCSFPFIYEQLMYCQRCTSRSVFANDRECARDYNRCLLASGEWTFCLRDVTGAGSTPPINISGVSADALKPTDCTDIAALGCADNGVYTIYIGPQKRPQSVYCDMRTDGKSWTVFQRRMDGSVNFYRSWEDYATGFGSLRGEFWLGNDKVNLLTSAKRYTLRIDMEKFDGTKKYAEYDEFKVDSSADNYRLRSIGQFTGTADDSLTGHLYQQFTTYDRDNDGTRDVNCAVTYKGAWWYNACHDSNLNGYYHGGPHESYADGIEWKSWTGYHYSLKNTEMKIRPV